MGEGMNTGKAFCAVNNIIYRCSFHFQFMFYFHDKRCLIFFNTLGYCKTWYYYPPMFDSLLSERTKYDQRVPSIGDYRSRERLQNSYLVWQSWLPAKWSVLCQNSRQCTATLVQTPGWKTTREDAIRPQKKPNHLFMQPWIHQKWRNTK